MSLKKKLIRYPWNRWFRNHHLVLTKGKDFHCMTHAMGVQVRQAAAKRGHHVSVSITKTGLDITISQKSKVA